MQARYNIKKASAQIQKWQAESRLTGLEVAKKSRISPSYYTNIKKGRSRGSIEVLSKICTVLGHDVNELIIPDPKTTVKIPKTKLKQTLRSVVGSAHIDDAVECIQLWLQAPDNLKRALRAFAMATK